jgi:hypothetical protein
MEMIITVVNARLEEARKELNKMVRKAGRFGAQEIKYNISPKRIEIRELQEWDSEGTRKVRIPVNDIEIEGEAPRVGDFTFLARIEHTQMGNLIMVSPDHDGELDPKWRGADCSCSHCARKRKRNDTFILRNDDTSEQVQVGRTCLQDFLGVNPEHILRKFEFFKKVRELSGEYGSFKWCHETKHILELAATVIRLYGWCPKSQETETVLSTSSEVGIVLSDSPSKAARRKQIFEAMTDEDRQLAKDTMNWVRNELNPNSDYAHNLVQLISPDVLTDPRFLGFVVSAVPSYCKHKQRQVEYARKKSEDQNSVWLGTKGERLREIKVRQEMARVIGGDTFGECILYKLKTESGSILTWITSVGTQKHQGDEFFIDATVKDHVEWQNVKETRVTRVRVL